MARIALVHDVAGVAAVQAELLRNAGHDVDEIALPAIGASWKWPAKAFALPVRLAAYLPTISRLRSANYDVIHIHWLTHGIVGVLARRPFFVQAHGSDVHVNLNRPLYLWVNRAVLKGATRVFYVTPNLRSYLQDFDAKLIYLPNPVDMPDIGQPVSPPSRVSKVLIFTRLDPIKGIDDIFPAAERLSEVVDITAFDWGPLARSYIASYGRWVSFLKPIPHARIAAFLHAFDVVIGQMRQGSLGLAEIEALAAGRPLITGIDWGQYPDDPPPVIAASGEKAVVDAIEHLRRHPGELAALSRAGRDWAYRNHGFHHHLKLLETAYFGSRGDGQTMSPRQAETDTS